MGRKLQLDDAARLADNFSLTHEVSFDTRLIIFSRDIFSLVLARKHFHLFSLEILLLVTVQISRNQSLAISVIREEVQIHIFKHRNLSP